MARDRRRDRWTLVEPEWFQALAEPAHVFTDAEKDQLFASW
jgi:hypothetical protein